MKFTDRDLRILKDLPYGRSYKEQAKRVGMNVPDYLDRKALILEFQRSDEMVSKDIYISDLEDKITESKINLDTGTGTLQGLFSYEPLSGVEVEKMFKIDTTQWRLSSYWNKQQASGKYLISANITQLKTGEVSRDEIVDTINKVFSIKEIVPYTYMQKLSNNKSLMVYTSDKHVGAFVGDEALYENNYTGETFEVRMQLLLEEIFYLETVFGTFENIYIMDLGDSMDGLNGQTTRKTHIMPQNMSNKEAFETYVRAHKNFFDLLCTSEVSNNYHFTALVNDNHSADFGYFTTRTLEEYLNIKYPQLRTTIIKKFIGHFEQGIHTFILCHGKDSEDMRFGLPLHINDKTENFINYYIAENNIDTKNSIIHFVKGDLHQNTSENAANFRYRNVYSMFGSSKWAQHNYIPQSPGVSFDIVEDNTERVFEHQIKYKSKLN